MTSTTEQERQELHRTIWSIADDLRGAVDGWDFKNYVIITMFYRYISEDICSYLNKNEIKSGNKDFDYEDIPDDKITESLRGEIVKEKGFFIFPSELFSNVRKRAKNDKDLNVTLQSIFNNIEASAQSGEARNDFKGLFKESFKEFDVNSNKLGNTVEKRNEKLVKLLNGIGEMKLGKFQDNSIDMFGDAYEFLMAMYASNAGKSGGEFFTPAEVSELLVHIGTVGKKEIGKIYDPACGSGSLLLKAEKVLGKDNVDSYYGQEINISTYNLCRINMFLHNINFDKFDIACGDTLISPYHKCDYEKDKFDLIVSNPPYSIKWEGDLNPLLINDERFSPAGVLAPKSKADLAFVMHCLYCLSNSGAAVIICFPGVLYRGGAEYKIRKYLVDNNYIDCIIQLPSNLFFGTSIATSIMVLKKNKKHPQDFLFIDASKEFFKVTNKNKLTAENINNIVNTFKERRTVAHYAYLATKDEIVNKDYNLSVSNYVEEKDCRDKIDIKKLNADLENIVKKVDELRENIRNIIQEIENE